MKKYFSLVITGVLALFIAAVGVDAAVNTSASKVTFECDKTTIRIGESTVCTISISPSLDGQGEFVNVVRVQLKPSEYLELSGFTPNAAAGFTQTSAEPSTHAYSFSTNSTTIISGAQTQVFSFTAKLSEKANPIA